MERLTHKSRSEAGYKENKGIPLWECLDKLGQLEDLEKQNRLLELPCAVGDTVYADSGVFGILAYTVNCIVIDKTFTFQCSSYSESIGDCPSECLDEIEPDISDFGKTVFLTREEAEAALERMGAICRPKETGKARN